MAKKYESTIILASYLTCTSKVAPSIHAGRVHVDKCDRCKNWIKETEQADAMWLNLQRLGQRHSVSK